MTPSAHTEEGDGVGEAQAAIEEWRWREEVEYEVRADGDVNEESDMAVQFEPRDSMRWRGFHIDKGEPEGGVDVSLDARCAM